MTQSVSSCYLFNWILSNAQQGELFPHQTDSRDQMDCELMVINKDINIQAITHFTAGGRDMIRLINEDGDCRLA